MFGVTLLLLVGVFVRDFASCSVKCVDGSFCPDKTTCCWNGHGYSCCGYPNAVCCADHTHCCPSGYRCNLATQNCEKLNEPWVRIPMVKKDAAQEPSVPVLPVSQLQELESNLVPDQKSSVVHCDSYYTCPDRTKCCRHPTGAWFCCPYYPGQCCLDGYHCCPYGFDCDLTYTHCVKQGLRFPFTPKRALSSFPASVISALEDNDSPNEAPMTALSEASEGDNEAPMTALSEASEGDNEVGVIRCDSKFYCSSGTSCCKGSKGQWSCCPYPLGTCCGDGQHCCEYGYTCDPYSKTCRK